MLTKIRNVDFVSKEVKYHGLSSCRYQKRAENVQNNNNLRPNSVKSNSKQTSDWHFSRQVHTEAFKSYVALSKRKKYINLTILITIINKFCMN